MCPQQNHPGLSCARELLLTTLCGRVYGSAMYGLPSFSHKRRPHPLRSLSRLSCASSPQEISL